jgi:hypothetical protein
LKQTASQPGERILDGAGQDKIIWNRNQHQE